MLACGAEENNKINEVIFVCRVHRRLTSCRQSLNGSSLLKFRVRVRVRVRVRIRVGVK